MGELVSHATPVIEAPKVESPGLSQTRLYVRRYRQIVSTSDEDFNYVKVEALLKKNGLENRSIFRETDILYSRPQSDVVIRTDATRTLLRKVIRHGLDKLDKIEFDSVPHENQQLVSVEVREYGAKNSEGRLQQDLDELEEVLHFRHALDKTAREQKLVGPPVWQKDLDEAVKIYQAQALRSLLGRADELFVEDVFTGQIPYLKGGLTGEQKVEANNALRLVKQVMVLAGGSEDLNQGYSQLLEPLDVKQRDLMLFLRWQISQDTQRLLARRNIFEVAGKKGDIAENVINNFARARGWEHLVVSTDQTKKIYELVSPVLLRNLFAGGYESWDGTVASSVFARLRDARVLPFLIEHIRRFGSGHTTNAVVYTIAEIATNPLDQADLDQVLLQATPLQRSIVNNWFRDSSMVTHQIVQRLLKSGDGYGVASMIQRAEQYVSRGALLDVASRVAKSRGIEIDLNAMQGFLYNNEFSNKAEVEDLLMQNLDQVILFIAQSKNADWRLSDPKIFSALVNPADGDIAKFPKLIAAEGLGLEADDVAKIDKLYQSADLKKGAMARSSFAEGLLLLSSKTGGAEVMHGILTATTGASRDPERVRSIFALLKSLDSFGSFEFTPKASLGEIISDLKGKLVEVIVEKMELGEEESLILSKNLEALMKTDVFVIIPQLLAKFHTQNQENVVEVVREIGRHIVLGDFKQWRNNLTAAQTQLSILSKDQQTHWLNPSPEINLQIGLSTDAEIRRGAVEAIRRIAQEARAHVLEVYKLDFSPSGIAVLKHQQEDLVRQLKDSGRDKQERKDLGEQKRKIDDRLRIVEGLLGLENLSVQDLNPIRLGKYIEGISSALSTFSGLNQAASDLAQVSEVLTTQAEIGQTAKLRIYDTDDPMSLLKVGIEPRETCQSYRGGTHNYCLPAYVADANKRVINVENPQGEVLGRSVIKLTHILDKDGQSHPAILLEPIYTTSEIASIYRGIIRVALEKARAIGAYLVIKGEFMVNTGASNKKAIPIAEREAARQNRTYSHDSLEIFIPKSFNPYEYSDSLGGDISYFGRYMNLSDAIIVSP